MRIFGKTAILFALLSSIPELSAGQKIHVDSLINIVLKNEARHEGMSHVTKALQEIPLTEIDSVIQQKVTNETLDHLNLARLLSYKAFLYFKRNKAAEAIAVSNMALEYAEQSGDAREIGIVHLDLGNLYREVGFYSYSADHLQLSGEILSTSYPVDAAISFYEAAVTSYRDGKTERSLSKQKESLRHFRRIDKKLMDGRLNFYLMSSWNTMGLNYQRLKEYDSAIFSYRKADSVAHVGGLPGKFWNDKYWIAMLQANIGSVYVDMGKPEQALPLLNQDYDMMMSITPKNALNVKLYNVKALLQLKRIDQALQLMNKINDSYSKRSIEYWKVKAQVHQASNDVHGTLKSLYKLVALEDSIRRATEALNVSTLKAIYEVGSLEENLHQLTAERNQKQARIQIQVITFSLSLIMLAGVAFAYYRFNKKSKLQLAIIEEQKEEMTQQNDMLQEALDKLNATREQLIESAKMSSLGQMTAGLAHEINNPLNYISGGVQALDQSISRLVSVSNKNEKKRVEQIRVDIHGMLKSIYNGVGRASRIVQSLKTFSSKHAEFTRINITEPIEMALDILYGRIKDHGIVIHRHYRVDIKPISGNMSDLNQVFSNLIDNAIHAMEDAGKKELTIEATSVEKSVVVRIHDTGTGIPIEIQNKIIEPFFTTKETGKGTGLGLTISYGILKKHKGDLTFVSDPSGTCFTITIPTES